MSDRTVQIVLDVASGEAERGLERFTKAAERSADTAAKASERAAERAKRAEADLQRTRERNSRALAESAVAAGAAAGGLLLAVGKTGIEYNKLQQTSRAALTTILGGARQANAQMDKLDEFARTSPFAKQTFITAQQQMLAFGIEADKVVGYLEGINEAVAASGGSNQQISEIAFIMAQISAASKITATDLMQLGQRGVNAAELIGSQMGKTGAQIREEITAGTLGADEALDALAAGMSAKFAGASANVKETLGGAFDRVNAQWRDLSSSLMEPFVGTNNGGILVSLLNEFADFLKMVNSLPAPVKFAGGAVAVLTAGIGLMGAAYLTLLPRLQATMVALRALGVEHQRLSFLTKLNATDAAAFGRKMSAVTSALSAAAVSVGAWNAVWDQFQATPKSLEETAQAIERLSRTGDASRLDSLFRDANDESRLLVGGVQDVSDALAMLDYVEQSTGESLKKRLADLFGDGHQATQLEAQIRAIDDALASDAPAQAAQNFRALRESLHETQRSGAYLADAFPEYLGRIRDELTDNGLQSYADDAEALAAIAQGDLPRGLVQTERGVMRLEDAISSGIAYTDAMGRSFDAAADKTGGLAEEFEDLRKDVADAVASFIDVSGAVSSVIAKGEEAQQAAADRAREAREESARAAERARDEYERLRTELAGNAAGFLDLGGAISTVTAVNDEATAAAKALREAYEQTRSEVAQSAAGFVDIGGSIGDFVDGAKFDLAEYMLSLERQASQMAAWQRNMVVLASSASEPLLDHLRSLGPKSAPLVEALVKDQGNMLERLESVYGQAGKSATEAWAEELMNAEEVWGKILSKAGAGAVEAAKKEIASGRSTLADVAERYGIDVSLGTKTPGRDDGLDAYTRMLEEQLSVQQRWQDNMRALAGRASDDLLTELERLGPEGAPLVQRLVDASGAELSRFEDVVVAGSQRATDAWAGELLTAKGVLEPVAAEVGSAVGDALQDGVSAGAGQSFEAAKFDLQDFLIEMEQQVAEQQQWMDNLAILADRMSEEALNSLKVMGADGQELVASLVDASDGELRRMEEIFRVQSEAASMAMAEELVPGAEDATAEAVDAAQRVAAERPLEMGVDLGTADVEMAKWYERWWDRIKGWFGGSSSGPSASSGGRGFANGGSPASYPSGGLVHGPGTTTSDDIFARLSRLEFVQRAAAVEYYGLDVMHAINQKQIPREVLSPKGYANGGSPGEPRRYIATPVVGAAGPKIVINSTSYYPVAEPKSTADKRTLEHAAALGV